MKYILPLLLFLPFTSLWAQTAAQAVISAQGDHSKGQTITMSWTLGDLATESAVFPNAILTQGFQQPTIQVREIELVSQRSTVAFDASVFPNPTGTDITVQVENANTEYHLELYDGSGNLLSRSMSTNHSEVIDLHDFPAAQYLLRVSVPAADQVRTFQIIKAQK